MYCLHSEIPPQVPEGSKLGMIGRQGGRERKAASRPHIVGLRDIELTPLLNQLRDYLTACIRLQ